MFTTQVTGLHVKRPSLLSNFNQNYNASTDFKTQQYQISANLISGSRTCEQAKRQTRTRELHISATSLRSRQKKSDPNINDEAYCHVIQCDYRRGLDG
jgi:hypothetical protein